MSLPKEKVEEAKTSQIRQRVRALQSEGMDIINLAAGELIGALPPQLKQGAIKAIESDCNLYTDTAGLLKLRKTIAERSPVISGFGYTPEQIVITGGAKLALYETMLALLSSGDEVLIPRPFWSTFSAQAKLVGARVKVIETLKPHYDLDSRAIASAITSNTRMVILNTPCNPTGRVWPDEEMKKVIQLAIEKEIWILWDACYAEILFDNRLIPSPLRLNPGAIDHTIVIGSFSKAYAIAGWRLGYLAAPTEVAKTIGALQSRISSNANALAQQTLLNVLSETQVVPYQVATHIQNNRDMAWPRLKRIPVLRPIEPQGGFYIFCDIDPMEYREKRLQDINDIDDVVLDLIEYAGVAVTPGSAFNSKTGVRLALSVPTSDLSEGLKRLENLLN